MQQTPIECVRCHRVIGRSVEVNGAELIHIGDIAAREVHGVCVHCGEAFHWTVSDQMLRRLLEDRKGRKSKHEGKLTQ